MSDRLLIIQSEKRTHLTTRDIAFVTYALPIYAIYMTIWTSSLWVRRSELLGRMASILGQYALLRSECGPLLASKLDKQLSIFPATWDRYENVAYASQIWLVYGILEPEPVRKSLRRCVLDLGLAVDQVKAYEQYEDFRYFGRMLDKSTALLRKQASWKTIAFYFQQALFGDKRVFPYIALLLMTVIAVVYLKDPAVKGTLLGILLVVDYFCVENLYKLSFGLFSISRNLAIKLFYHMKIPNLWV